MLSTSTGNSEPPVAITDLPERRQHVRYSFTASMEAFEPDSQTRIQGRTADLSAGGCYVDTMNPFPTQTRLNVRITRGTGSFQTQATVVYSATGMGMGLRFEEVAPQQHTVLKNWLAELSGESTAKPEFQEEPDLCRHSPDLGQHSGDVNEVLNELVRELMRKGVLAEDIAKRMLKRLAPAA